MAPFANFFLQTIALISSITLTQAATLERRMTYRDNQVLFKLSRFGTTTTIPYGEFIIKDLSITPGQDPEIRNKPGDTKQWTALQPYPQRFSFSVGRKKTSQVANWWTTTIGSGSSTFGNTPKELNFAFLGTLKLQLPGRSGGPFVGVFEDVLMGQGHSGATNNWWFGGKNCRMINPSGKTVACKGVNSSDGKDIEVWFKRGGQMSVNEIDIENMTFYETTGGSIGAQ